MAGRSPAELGKTFQGKTQYLMNSVFDGKASCWANQVDMTIPGKKSASWQLVSVIMGLKTMQSGKKPT